MSPFTTSERSAHRGWRAALQGNVLAMGLTSLFTDFSSEMMNPLMPVFLAGLAGSGPDALAKAAVAVGVMEGLAETISALLKLGSGRLSDRLGKRKAFVVIGYGLSSLARPLMGAAASVWQAVVLKGIDRVGKGLRTSPRDALIGDSVGPDARGLAFSVHRAMDHCGAVLGPLAAVAVLYAFLGKDIWQGSTTAPSAAEMRVLRILFCAAIVPGMLAMLAVVFRVREITPAVRAPAAALPGDSAWRRLPRRFYGFVGIVALFALGNSSDMFLILLAKLRFGFGLVPLIGLWVVLHLSKIVFSIPGGHLSDRFGRRPILLAGWLIYTGVYMGFALTTQAWAFWTLIAVYGAYHGLTEGVEKALVADFVPSDLRGTAYGLYHGAVGIALLPASLVFGVVWRQYGAAVSFGIGAGCAGLATVLLAILLGGGRNVAGGAQASAPPLVP